MRAILPASWRRRIGVILGIICMIGIVGGGFLVRRVWTNTLPAESDIFFSIGALPFLRGALRENGPEIDTLLECLDLWKITARELPTAPDPAPDAPDDGPPRGLVSLQFAAPDRKTTRVYEMSYLVEHAGGNYVTIRRQADHVSLTRSHTVPAVPSETGSPLRNILVGALDDDGFEDDLQQWLQEWQAGHPGEGIRQLMIAPTGISAGQVDEFNLILYRGGYPGEDGAESMHWFVYFDRSTGDVRVLGEDQL